ncbi:MAG: rhodanese-like domain-containing protein [Pseudomonadota bacterium]
MTSSPVPRLPSLALLSGYSFQPLTGLPLKRERIKVWLDQAALKGTVLLAAEGINFSLCGPPDRLDQWLAWLGQHLQCATPVLNRQAISDPPFQRLKVRIRPEIVTFEPRLGPHSLTPGEPIAPEHWNALIERHDIQLVDTRNHYEVNIGSFEGALNPDTDSFTEFQQWTESHLDPNRPVAMFCTGGVRCEKASDWLKRQGYAQVYQLKGGILSYLAQVEPAQSKWWGDCFVFDDRVALGHDLRPSGRALSDQAASARER